MTQNRCLPTPILYATVGPEQESFQCFRMALLPVWLDWKWSCIAGEPSSNAGRLLFLHETLQNWGAKQPLNTIPYGVLQGLIQGYPIARAAVAVCRGAWQRAWRRAAQLPESLSNSSERFRSTKIYNQYLRQAVAIRCLANKGCREFEDGMDSTFCTARSCKDRPRIRDLEAEKGFGVHILPGDFGTLGLQGLGG